MKIKNVLLSLSLTLAFASPSFAQNACYDNGTLWDWKDTSGQVPGLNRAIVDSGISTAEINTLCSYSNVARGQSQWFAKADDNGDAGTANTALYWCDRYLRHYLTTRALYAAWPQDAVFAAWNGAQDKKTLFVANAGALRVAQIAGEQGFALCQGMYRSN